MPRTFRNTLGGTFVVLACLAAFTATAGARPAYLDDRHPGDDPRSILWEPKQAAFEKLQAALALPPDAVRALQENYDVHYYDIDIEIDEGPETVAGSVVVRATSTIEGLSTVILDLYDNMTVDSVEHDGAPVASGVYFARLVADSGTASRKLLLVRQRSNGYGLRAGSLRRLPALRVPSSSSGFAFGARLQDSRSG